ncbi:MAG: inosine/xanthosine triphosphatase [Halobacteriales archaeon]
MRVAVGSTNPVKEHATADALSSMPGAVVEAVDVASGVSEQPFGHAETLHGADTRAANALASGDFDLGVGIEGGVAEYDVDTADQGRSPVRPGEARGDAETSTGDLYLVMWATVTDGDRESRGGGPNLRLPDRVADRVRRGEELGPVMDDEFDMENVKENEGAAGVLTGNIIDRRGALEMAVAGALGPFVSDAYD